MGVERVGSAAAGAHRRRAQRLSPTAPLSAAAPAGARCGHGVDLARQLPPRAATDLDLSARPSDPAEMRSQPLDMAFMILLPGALSEEAISAM